ncbi:MAG: transporter substrate-binding domain-containing protein [Chloroflexi bacterium]|nr:transporter substrate-binding domain-containing protein [Chloroflexota bacterium]
MPRFGVSIIALVILALVATACGDTPPPTTDASQPAGESEPASSEPAESEPASSEPAESEPPATGDGILAAVQERGELVCGINGTLPGFSVLDAEGNTVGFDADFCRAIAAAVLGDSEAVQFRELTADQRSTALQTGEIDVLIRNTTWTVSRDTSWGLFAPTTFYDGQAIMVNSTQVDATSIEELDGATVCVLTGTTTEQNLQDAATNAGIELTPETFPEAPELYSAYTAENSICDAATSDRSQLTAQRSGFENPDDHLILDDVLSKEPLGPVAPLGDDGWFNVVKWVVFATIEAEELELTSDNVEEMASSSENPVVQRLLGVTPEGDDPFESGLGLEPDWVVTMISQVGNYAEIYDRNLGPETAVALERGLNSLWTDDGLLYAPPYR